MLKNKKVLLGITSSIAAYKAAELVRLFKKLGAIVKVIQTKSSISFITPLTLSTLSENLVLTDMVDTKSNEWNSHVDLALWADLMVIAPITAKSMAKMVTGDCDNLLIATYLSAKCQVYFAPAMDLDMYKHKSTSNNISKLVSYGNILIPSGFGELASGLVGEGRMAEPSEIIDFIINDLNSKLQLNKKKIIITAGPTYEMIDSVRFIGNKSSGKMGVALANECANNGANVDLVLGPSYLKCNHPNINTTRVESANEMYKFVSKNFKKYDIAIFSAAVSDLTPVVQANNKLKKSAENMRLEFKTTIDIAKEMSRKKLDHQFTVGFALETNDELSNAKVKLNDKNLDMIVLNSLNCKGAGFGYDTNKITILDKNNNVLNFKLKKKSDVAKDIISHIIKLS